MKFKLECQLPDKKGEISHQKSLLTIGSCFSAEIGSRLKNSGFNVNVNPLGTLFSADAIRQVLLSAINESQNVDHVLVNGSKVFHYNYHSDLVSTSEKELIDCIKRLQSDLRKFIIKGDVLIITLGTAWVYRLKSSSKLVANCHKMPSDLFEKELLDLSQQIRLWGVLIEQISLLNPDLSIMLTISPVRHSKDGLRENNVSKGLLQQLAWTLERQYDCVSYFPAYEIIIDELRDYRFYSEDLVHPSNMAVDYVYEQFCRSYFDEKTIALKRVNEKIYKAENHKFVNPTEEERQHHAKHLETLNKELEKLSK